MTTQDFSRDGALALAARHNLDPDQFAQCFDSQTHLDRVESQHRTAAQNGITRTPTVHLNGQGAATIGDALIEQVRALADELGIDLSN